MMKKFGKGILNILKAFLLPAIIYVVFTIITNGRFGSKAMMLSVLRTAVVPMLIALGMSMNMIAGMWDFSAGSVVVASAILGANITAQLGWGIPGLFLFSILIGLVLNIVKGLLYNWMRVPSLVLSLGLTIVYESLPHLLIEDSTGSIGIMDGYMAQIPNCLYIVGAMLILLHLVFTYTTFGRNITAIGADIRIASSAGIDLDKNKFLSFVGSGLFFGLAGAMYMSLNTRVSASTNFASISLIFDSMMGVFIAMLLVRYVPFAFAVAIGTLTIRMLGSALVACGMTSHMRSMSTGFFLLIVLTVSVHQNLFSDMRMRKKTKALADAEFQVVK